MSKKGGRGGAGAWGGGLKLPEPRYDYEDCVKRISEAYLHQNWEGACSAAQALSEKCPMTPLLWLQYAKSIQQLLKGENNCDGSDNDAGASGPFVSVLELALLEFPASSLLHYERVRALLPKKKLKNCHEANDEDVNEGEGAGSSAAEAASGGDDDAFRQALKEALEAVGTGSHPVDPLVHGMYELQFQTLVDRQSQEKEQGIGAAAAATTLDDVRTCLRRWTQFCPTSDVRNESAVSEFRSSGEEIRDWFASSVQMEMEEARKVASIHYQHARSFEDDVTIAMERQGIAMPHQDTDWTAMDASQATYGMGLGDTATARVFVRYARSILKKSVTPEQHTWSSSKLALQVLERGIVECPTVELLWMEYVEILQQLINNAPGVTKDETDEDVASVLPQWLARIETVLARAIRNCPYSARLVRARISSYELLSRHGAAVVDPDALLNHVRDAVQSGFLLRPVPTPTTNGDDSTSTDQSVSQIVVDLCHTVLHVIKQRILSLLTVANPKATAALRAFENGTNKKPPAISSILQQRQDSADLAVTEEVGDLLEDLGDLYEEMDKVAVELLGQSQATGAVRSWLCRDGSHTQQFMLSPLLKAKLGDDAESSSHSPESAADAVKTLKWMEQAIKLHNPPHPDLILDFVHLLGMVPSANVLQRIRLLRFTFAKGVRGVGRSKTHSHRYNNYDLSLRQLCHEWLDFEANWGSADSLSAAQQAVQKKLAAATAAVHSEEPNLTKPERDSTRGKRPYPTPGDTRTSQPHADESTDSQERDNKRSKSNLTNADDTPDLTIVAPSTPEHVTTDSTNHEPVESHSTAHTTTTEPVASPKTKVVYKVRVGKLDFPAHPYTVKVSNLAPDTADMDLVDAFRRCGTVVHARIVRDKSHLIHSQGGGHWRHGGAPAVAPSKGYGLVQFEERESVEAALALHDVIGLHERVLHVERSHIPAALIVPPGMHRVSEKGQGKYSKRNERRKELVSAHKGGSDEGQPTSEPGDASKTTDAAPSENPNPVAPAKPAAASMSVLSFRPRGVGRGGHQKTRIVLPKDTPK
jgi:RNA recognition motif-containing protein